MVLQKGGACKILVDRNSVDGNESVGRKERDFGGCVNPRYPFSFNGVASPELILTLLKECGIVHLPQFVGGKALQELNHEFQKIFDKEFENVKISRYGHGFWADFCREGMDTSEFPWTKKIFYSPFMRGVVDLFFGTPSELNDEIVFTHDFPHEKPINPLHFDQILSLKFFLYLKDTTQENGAFEYVPGSHVKGRELANKFLKRGRAIRDVPNIIEEDYERGVDLGAIPIEGRSGTLIIFDSDGFHRGGIVREGQERMVMRGQSHSFPRPLYKPKKFSKQWWIEHQLNPGRFFGLLPGRGLDQGWVRKQSRN
jgi:hypothetical protein